MATFLITFGLLVFVVCIMSIGFIVKRKAINGSCGGLASVGVNKVCNCPEPCDNRKAKMEVEALIGKRVTRAAVAKRTGSVSKRVSRQKKLRG